MKDISIRSHKTILVLALVALSLMQLIEKTRITKWDNSLAQKEEAMFKMKSALHSLSKHANQINLPIDPINDPFETGLIGSRFSEITSGRGALYAKLASIDPHSAAVMIELMQDAGFKKGDLVVIGMTGSFPGMNLASIIAAEVLELEVASIASLTSSSWGANNPDFTWLDIHSYLKEQELISSPILGASIGANNDIGRSLSRTGRILAQEAIERNNVQPILLPSLEANIEERLSLISTFERSKGKLAKGYINIGGGIASLGSRNIDSKLNSGLVLPALSLSNHEILGVAPYFLSEGKPVINIQNIETLFGSYGLNINDSGALNAENTTLFAKVQYKLPVVGVSLFLLISLITGIVILDNRKNALGTQIIPLPKENNLKPQLS